MATPAPDPNKMGTESRSSVLPTSTPPMDFVGPNYSFADELPFPNEKGAVRGDSLGSVVDAARAAGYYADMITYGGASSPFTASLNPQPMGVNYFVNSGSKCSNGANMWLYVNGIPKGDAFGGKIQQALSGMGLPALRGLAPGMIEDVKAGLDPTGVVNSIFGSGYMKCKSVTLPVGDSSGRIKGRDGSEWIRPLFPGDIEYIGKPSRPFQTRWVFDRWMTQEEYQKEYDLRTFCPDGSTIANHEGLNCDKPLLKPTTAKKEGFEGSTGVDTILPVTLLLGLTAILYVRFRN